MHSNADTPTRARALPPHYVALAILTMVALRVIFPWRPLVLFPWSLAGMLPLGLGVALNLVADAQLKRHATTVKPFEESAALVTTGAYGICRHPMYLGGALILLGLGVILGCATPFVVIPVFVALIETRFVRVEERMMEHQFGSAWRDYTARVSRWL